MHLVELHREIDRELQMAADSRLEGNEGRARVCARRAAGLAIGVFFEDLTGRSETITAYNLLRWLSSYRGMESEIREAARRLTIRVTSDHELPHQQDPIEDAKLIIDSIVNDMRTERKE